MIWWWLHQQHDADNHAAIRVVVGLVLVFDLLMIVLLASRWRR